MWVSHAWLLVGLLIWGARSLPGQTSELPEQEKVFYALGLSLARATFNFDLTPEELDIVKRGLTDGVMGKRRQVKRKRQTNAS